MSWLDGHDGLADLRAGIEVAMRFHDFVEREDLRDRRPQRTGGQPVKHKALESRELGEVLRRGIGYDRSYFFAMSLCAGYARAERYG